MRYVYMIVGLVAFALGAAGVWLPILPTTPFLLLALMCFTRSSPRMERYLLRHDTFGPFIIDYYSGQLTRSQKLRIVGLLWLGMGASIWVVIVVVGLWPVALLLVGIGAGVSAHIWRLRPCPERAAKLHQRAGLPTGHAH
ncbi:YbaN family protein [Corynebacterium riegelii]